MTNIGHDLVALAKKACSHLEKRYDEERRGLQVYSPLDYGPFIDLMTDDAIFKVPCPEDTPVFGGEFKGKEAIKKLLLEDDPNIVEDLHVQRPLEYFVNEDRVVVLTAYTYKIKETGDAAFDKDIALVLDFVEGRISKAVEIQDLSEWVVSYRESTQRTV